MRELKLPLAAFAIAFAILAATAGPRLGKQSCATHFVAQADAWLHHETEIKEWPKPCGYDADDQATVEEVQLDDGSTVQGRRIASRQTFRVAGGGEIPISRVTKSVRSIHYVSFPPFPSVLMLPLVAISGPHVSDVTFTLFFAALVPAAFLLLLRRLREAGLSQRTPVDEATLAALITFGTVFWFSAVQGAVWFTAHVIGVLLCILYAWAAIGAARPGLAGLFLGLAFVTRAPMLFMFPLFAFEAWRVSAGNRRALAIRAVKFAAPVIAIGLVAAWYNVIRFHEPTEFGHSYLAVVQQEQIEKYGLFSLHYLGRNLAVAFTLLPDLSSKAPHVSISGHGLAMWITTPPLLLLLWPREKGPLHRALWITVACVAGFSLLYQNSGWLQFGYRFSLDYMVFLILLLAVGGRPLGTWRVRTLVALAIAVNLFGAVTFGRMNKYYRADRTTPNSAYNCVVPN